MPLNAKYSADSAGGVKYSNKVLVSIIELAVREIAGVAALSGKGIRLDFNGKAVNAEIFIDVAADVSCTDVAFRVQENVKRSLETMTEFKAEKVNVNIVGVHFEKEEAAGL